MLADVSEQRRVLITGESVFGAVATGLANGFRQAGWDVEVIDPQTYLPRGVSTSQRAAARSVRHFFIAAFNDAVLTAARSYRPFALVAMKGSYLKAATLKEIGALGIHRVNYFTDFHFDHPDVDEETFPAYDWFFTTKSFQVEHLRQALPTTKVRFLHHGFSAQVHYPRADALPDTAFIADALYVGNHSPYKERWLRALASAMPSLRLRIAGNGWNASSFGRPDMILPAVTGDSYARLLQLGRINVAFHAGPKGPRQWADLVSMRTFEIPACKGFMLHIDNAEVRTLFSVGEEIDVFGTEDELGAKIDHYLAHPEQRRAMIEAAYRRAVPAYSYEERARAMLHDITAQEERRHVGT